MRTSRRLAPHFLLVLLAVAVEDFAAVLDGERRSQADAEAHLFLIAERERAFG